MRRAKLPDAKTPGKLDGKATHITRKTTSSMAEYRLYCFAQSGNAYKAALMLSLCGADWEPRFVDFFNGETRTPEYRAINVPVDAGPSAPGQILTAGGKRPGAGRIRRRLARPGPYGSD